MERLWISVLYHQEWQREKALQLIKDAEIEGRVIAGWVEPDDFHRVINLRLRPDAVNRRTPVPQPEAPYFPIPLLGYAEQFANESRGLQVFVVQFAGPILTRWRQELGEIGATVLERLGANEYTVRSGFDSASRLRELRFIVGVRPYTVADTLMTPVSQTNQQGVVRNYAVLLHPGGDYEFVETYLRGYGVEVTSRSSRVMTFESFDYPTVVVGVAALVDVEMLDTYGRARPTCDNARVLVGAGVTLTTVPTYLTGAGQTIAVADTGFDDQHPDIHGRISLLSARGRPGNSSDPTGHGTHVAAIAAGNGQSSGPAGIVGVAPEASLVLQSVMDTNGKMTGLYQPDLNALFDEAYLAGARIMNNSWGTPNNSTYRVEAHMVDEWVAAHPEMLLVFSAGNGGTAVSNRNSPVGYVDLFSIGDPATAKNVITVGASRSDRVGNPPEASQQWRARDSRAFGDPPIADELVAGDPLALAADSSRGPCREDARIKPDVVAPGTLILAARATTAPTGAFHALHSTLPDYAYLSGTSVAAPFVTGCAALLRQYLVDVVGHVPGAALLKALLVNGTEWLTAQDSIAWNAAAPNYHQGFGRVDLLKSIPNSADPDRRLAFCDDWQGADCAFTSQSDVFVVSFEAGPDVELRMCLTWLDLPGRAVQQQLHLWAQDPDAQDHRGNDKRYSTMFVDDGANNVQIVRIEKPTSGKYVAQIAALSLMNENQTFAFTVTGQLNTPLTVTKYSDTDKVGTTVKCGVGPL